MLEGRGSQAVRQAVEVINSGLQVLAEQELEPLEPRLLGEDIELLQRCVSRIQLESSRRLRRFDSDGGFRAGGEASAVDWLRDHGRMSAGSAVKQVKLARQLAELE